MGYLLKYIPVFKGTLKGNAEGTLLAIFLFKIIESLLFLTMPRPFLKSMFSCLPMALLCTTKIGRRKGRLPG